MGKHDTYPICRGVLCVCVLFLGDGARAAVTLDGTLGPARSLRGPDYVVRAQDGETRGTNLFHSFGQFSLTSSESATFTGPARIQNIIGRVTGGEVSSIDGLVSSSITGANLYLINPTGIMFGPNAQLDVSGSFYASTADYLRLGNGGRFDARNPGASVLRSAPPEAFGFLGPPAPITVAGSLSVPAGKTLGLVGGNITISGELAVLDAPSGRIDLVAVASAGELALTSSAPDVSAFTALGDVLINNNALVSTAGDPGGTIYIRSGRLVIESAMLDSGTFGAADHPGTGIDIAVRGEFILGVSADPNATDGLIDSSSFGAGRAGDIRIEAGSFRLAGDAAGDRFAEVASRAFDSGRGGNIILKGVELEVGPSAIIVTESFGTGDAGDISINVSSLRLDGTTGSGSFIASSAFDAGSAGNLVVSADDVLLQGFGAVMSVDNFAGLSPGPSGSLTLTAGRLRILDEATISTFYFGDSAGGNINIKAHDILISGGSAIFSDVVSGDTGEVSVVAGNISVAADNLVMSRGGTINSSVDVRPGGNAGNIQITAQNMELTEGASVATLSAGFTIGSISINAERLRLVGGGTFTDVTGRGDASIAALALGRGGEGGGIRIDSRDLQILDGARIDSSNIAITEAGAIEIRADRLLVAGRDANGESSSITAVSASLSNILIQGPLSGRGGDIKIEAGEVVVRDHGLISVESRTDGDAGNLRIAAGTISLSGNASISATATGTGNAGNIELVARDALRMQDSSITTQATQSAGGNITVAARSLVRLNDSSITASVQGGAGSGGNIAIDPDFVVLNHSRITADAVGGNGGNVTIVAGNFLASADSSVTASSALGLQGNVVIRAPTQDLSGEIEKLPETALDASARFKSNCAAVGSRFSSFTVPGPSVAAAGRGWIPSAYAGIGADTGSIAQYEGVPRSDSLLAATASPAQGCRL